MEKAELPYEMDRKLSDLWRFSTKSVSSHIIFAQYMYSLIELAKKNPSLKSILPIEDLIILTLYHLRSMIMKKYKDDFEIIRPFHTVYLESICQIYPSLTPPKSRSLDNDQLIGVDNDELITRINQNEKLINSCKLFTGFCRQKHYSIVKDGRKKPITNPMYSGMSKSIDSLKYENERLTLFISKFNVSRSNVYSPRKKLTNSSVVLNPANGLIKIEILKLSREAKNLDTRQNFLYDFKINAYNNLSTALINIQHLSKHKIEKCIYNERRPDIVSHVFNAKYNNANTYRDSIHTLQNVITIDNDFTVLKDVIEDKNEGIPTLNFRSQTTEDASNVIFSDSRSYHVSNNFFEKSEQSFQHDFVDHFFQNSTGLYNNDNIDAKSDSFKCVSFHQLSNDFLDLDKYLISFNENSNNNYQHLDVEIQINQRQDDSLTDITEQDFLTDVNEVDESANGIYKQNYKKPPINISNAVSSKDANIIVSYDTDDTATDPIHRTKTMSLIEQIELSDRSDCIFPLVERDAGKSIESMIGNMYQRSCNADSVKIGRGDPHMESNLEIVSNTDLDYDLKSYKPNGYKLTKLNDSAIQSDSTCAMAFTHVIDCDNCLLDERLNKNQTCCLRLRRKFRLYKSIRV